MPQNSIYLSLFTSFSQKPHVVSDKSFKTVYGKLLTSFFNKVKNILTCVTPPLTALCLFCVWPLAAVASDKDQKLNIGQLTAPRDPKGCANSTDMARCIHTFFSSHMQRLCTLPPPPLMHLFCTHSTQTLTEKVIIVPRQRSSGVCVSLCIFMCVVTKVQTAAQ